jgi:hypothetical protein
VWDVLTGEMSTDHCTFFLNVVSFFSSLSTSTLMSIDRAAEGGGGGHQQPLLVALPVSYWCLIEDTNLEVVVEYLVCFCDNDDGEALSVIHCSVI